MIDGGRMLPEYRRSGRQFAALPRAVNQKTLRNALICPIAARVLQLVEYTYGGSE
ncbi:MAG: hypothetical protein SVR04_09885 [Spirochaetota bacterium]|jgi:hypothetical protein|nr:hypothetical protein [Spirochaetota bacterium]